MPFYAFTFNAGIVQCRFANYRFRIHKMYNPFLKRKILSLYYLDINLPYYYGFYYCRLFLKYSKVPLLAELWDDLSFVNDNSSY